VQPRCHPRRGEQSAPPRDLARTQCGEFGQSLFPGPASSRDAFRRGSQFTAAPR
jgi:hypothetical protein